MEEISGCEEAELTQSFRFGTEIAAAASRVLSTLGEKRHIRGRPELKSTITDSGRADAVLARTNATVILEILEATRAGRKPCVCGGTQEIKRLLGDVYELKAGKPAASPEFFGFQNWVEVVEFANSEEGQALRTFVQLVEQHGEGKLWAAVKKAVPEEKDADIILSTAHKAKGREWDSVRLAPDFMNARLGPTAEGASEVRLFYVAMTRAKKSLIAEPGLLRTFMTDVWKIKQPEQSRRFSSAAAPSRPEPRPVGAVPRPNIHEIYPEARRMRHPGAATSPTHTTRADNPGRSPASPLPPVEAERRTEIREITPQARIMLHPGAAVETAADVSTPASVITVPVSERRTFWGRVARLFGA
jgi:hypothetical protein